MFIPTDHLFGAFDSFPTEIEKDGDVYVAKALGYEARHASQDQAINDLNLKLNEAIEKGELRPQM